MGEMKVENSHIIYKVMQYYLKDNCGELRMHILNPRIISEKVKLIGQ
jgi:hypothetical protein